jgi:hypothetical protein
MFNPLHTELGQKVKEKIIEQIKYNIGDLIIFRVVGYDGTVWIMYDAYIYLENRKIHLKADNYQLKECSQNNNSNITEKNKIKDDKQDNEDINVEKDNKQDNEDINVEQDNDNDNDVIKIKAKSYSKKLFIAQMKITNMTDTGIEVEDIDSGVKRFFFDNVIKYHSEKISGIKL